MALGQEALDLAKGVTEAISPWIMKLATWIAGFIQVEVANVHMILILVLAGWLAKFISDEALSLKHIVITVVLFLGLRYIGL